jgi:imidazolonepropionase-like amidohydrolase
MAERQALVGALLIDGTGADPIEDAVLAVEDGVIAYAGTKTAYSFVEGETVIDISGRTLMPGIIDCHCHLGGTSFPDEDNWVLEPDIYKAIASVHQANAMLQHGITSVRDISVHGTHLRKAITAGIVDGPRIVPCWRGLSRTGGHGDAAGVPAELVRTSHPWGIVADGVDECRKITREIVKQGSRCIKIWASGGGLHENEPEDAQHYSYEELKAVVDEANLVHLPVCAHCECASSALDAVKAGVWSIEHGEDLDEETIALMAERGVSLIPTLVLMVEWFEWSGEGGCYGDMYIPGGGDLPTDKQSLRVIHDRQLAGNLMAAKEAGIRIGLGSDTFCTGLTPYGQQSLNEVHCLVQAGLTKMEALVAATKSGAEILKIENVTGTLETGKAADYIVLDVNPLEDISAIDVNNMVLIAKEGRPVRNPLSLLAAAESDQPAPSQFWGMVLEKGV